MRPAAMRSVCTQPGTAAGRERPSIWGGTGPPPVARTVQPSCSALMLVLLVEPVADVLRRGSGPCQSSGPGCVGSSGHHLYCVVVAPAPNPSTNSRTMILDVIRASRTISRVELAAATGLTQATVSNVVRRLLEDGFVVEDGRGASTGGKPRTLLRIDICGSGGFALSAGATSMPATPRPWPPSAANEPASAPKKATAGADPEPRSSRRSDPASVHGQRAR